MYSIRCTALSSWILDGSCPVTLQSIFSRWGSEVIHLHIFSWRGRTWCFLLYLYTSSAWNKPYFLHKPRAVEGLDFHTNPIYTLLSPLIPISLPLADEELPRVKPECGYTFCTQRGYIYLLLVMYLFRVGKDINLSLQKPQNPSRLDLLVFLIYRSTFTITFCVISRCLRVTNWSSKRSSLWACHVYTH